MWRTDSFEKTIMLEKIEGRKKRGHRGWDGWMASLTLWTWIWVSSGSWWWTGKPGVLWFMGSQRVGHDWVTELSQSWHFFFSLYCSLLVPNFCLFLFLFFCTWWSIYQRRKINFQCTCLHKTLSFVNLMFGIRFFWPVSIISETGFWKEGKTLGGNGEFICNRTSRQLISSSELRESFFSGCWRVRMSLQYLVPSG